MRHGLGGFQVFVGLEGSAQELGIGAHNMWAFSSPHLEDDLQRYMALEPSPAELAAHDVPLIFISFPSAKVRGAVGGLRVSRASPTCPPAALAAGPYMGRAVPKQVDVRNRDGGAMEVVCGR